MVLSGGYDRCSERDWRGVVDLVRGNRGVVLRRRCGDCAVDSNGGAFGVVTSCQDVGKEKGRLTMKLKGDRRALRLRSVSGAADM